MSLGCPQHSVTLPCLAHIHRPPTGRHALPCPPTSLAYTTAYARPCWGQCLAVAVAVDAEAPSVTYGPRATPELRRSRTRSSRPASRTSSCSARWPAVAVAASSARWQPSPVAACWATASAATSTATTTRRRRSRQRRSSWRRRRSRRGTPARHNLSATPSALRRTPSPPTAASGRGTTLHSARKRTRCLSLQRNTDETSRIGLRKRAPKLMARTCPGAPPPPLPALPVHSHYEPPSTRYVPLSHPPPPLSLFSRVLVALLSGVSPRLCSPHSVACAAGRIFLKCSHARTHAFTGGGVCRDAAPRRRSQSPLLLLSSPLA
ncbi:hypothetical protein LSCM4_07524 [Leishmania orientalis]|uniref:Uncharacterized protein n=1 Tax=Leishmania orientalis TaxID=2249476 RepID=A0A836HPA2_9TRYP|nr:hypothetical protein LSCM4_07524 [Leishmania orientalis]